MSRIGLPEFSEIEEALSDADFSQPAAAKLLGISRSTMRSLLAQWKIAELAGKIEDEEMLAENVRLAKQRQKYQDLNRIERKAFREHARVENAIESFSEQLLETLKGYKFKEPPALEMEYGPIGGIIHWSDQHLNERVELAHNQFDWNVAGKRLRKHVTSCLRLCEAYGIDHVFVAMTGDLLNSDRRLDELMANAGNRSKACILAMDLYRQALHELSESVHVSVGAISGNESRVGQVVGWQGEVASDNYDFVIYEGLKLLMEESPIHFFPTHEPGEMVVNIAGQNVLFIHGHGAMTKDIQRAVQAAKGRYLSKGIKVDLMFWGHIHEALIADNYGRSSSLVGSNTFNEKALNLDGRASQNFYVVHESGGFDGVKIDLQDVSGINGYDLEERLQAYNTKSANKARTTSVIHRIEVVI